MTMAAKSSMMAKAVKNTFMLKGTREPSKANTPKANAMSVAVGIAQPLAVSTSPALNAKNISAGTVKPAKAAKPGNKRCCVVCKAPLKNSRLTSKPTYKKNTAIKASLIQCKTDRPNTY